MLALLNTSAGGPAASVHQPTPRPAAPFPSKFAPLGFLAPRSAPSLGVIPRTDAAIPSVRGFPVRDEDPSFAAGAPLDGRPGDGG